MNMSEVKLGLVGIVLGSIALLIALIAFWGGPFAEQPTLEEALAEKVLSLQDAAIKALNGEPIEDSYPTTSKWNVDKVIDISIPIVAVIAILMGVFSFVFKEPIRVSACAMAIGFSAIAFQFIAMYAMALLFVFLLVAIIGAIFSS